MHINHSITTVLLILASCLHPAATFDPGATASLDIGLIQQAKDVYWNYVMNVLANVKIPDISFHGGYIHDNTFNIAQASQNVQINTDVPVNGVKLSVTDLGAGFKSNHFEYKLSFLKAKGSVEVSMSHVNVAVDIGLTQQTLPNGKVVPGFTTSGVSVHIPSDHMSIKIKGNIISKIADAFKSLFKSTIVHEIEKELTSTINSELPKALNEVLAKTNGYSELYHDMDLDWSLPFSPKVTDKMLEFAIKGLFFKKEAGEVEPAVLPPAGMELYDASSPSKFQAFLSTYVLESASFAFLETNEIHFWTKSSDVPKDFPIQLNTSSLGQFLPGLVDKYGEDKLIDIEYKLDKVGNFSIRQDDSTLSFDGSLSVNFWVNTAPDQKDKALIMDVVQNHFNFTFQIPESSLNVTVNIKEVSIGDIVVTYTSFGKVDLKIMANLINQGISIGLPALNIYLETLKIRIPTKLFGLFTLSNLTLKYHNDYLEAGLTPKFLPPTEDIPGIYEQFVPQKWPEMDDSDRDYKILSIQEIDEDDNYSFEYGPDFTYQAYFSERVSQIWTNQQEKDDLFLLVQ